MPKPNFNKGSNTEGPHRQGEKGGRGGEVAKSGMSARPKGEGEQSGEPSKEELTRMSKTPTLSGKNSPTGKGSGNR